MPDSGEQRAADAPAEPRRRLVQRLFAALGLRNEASLRADLAGALEKDSATPDDPEGFAPEERAMLRNILGLREVKVADVAVPRADIVAVEEGVSLAELLTVFREAAHSRLPIYRETLDEPVGMVHIRDVLSYLIVGAPRRPDAPPVDGLDLGAIDLSTPLKNADIARQLLYVPPSMAVLDLLAQMQATHIHMALVIDEYGGTDGLVSIEDLIEQVIGDIEDEHDETETTVVASGDGWIASARATIDDVREALGAELALEVPPEIAEEVDTLGGLLGTMLGRVPVRGELVRGPGEVEFEVLDADPRRVKRVRIRRAPPPRPPEPPSAARDPHRPEPAETAEPRRS
jgi:CBS domain containing-hemolysin-like protein